MNLYTGLKLYFQKIFFAKIHKAERYSSKTDSLAYLDEYRQI